VQEDEGIQKAAKRVGERKGHSAEGVTPTGKGASYA